MSGSQVAHRAGFVSIAGRPNAGKSTLLNALIGEKVAITARQAQTTRTSVQGVLTMPGAQIVFVDTPGIHKSDSLFNKRMMETVRSALAGRDLVLYVVDSTKPIADEDKHAVSVLKHADSALLILNKIDRVDDKRLMLPLIQQYGQLHSFVETIPVSASKLEGLDDLKLTIVKYLPEGPLCFRRITSRISPCVLWLARSSAKRYCGRLSRRCHMLWQSLLSSGRKCRS